MILNWIRETKYGDKRLYLAIIFRRIARSRPDSRPQRWPRISSGIAREGHRRSVAQIFAVPYQVRLMNAVIKTGGKQYRVSEGDKLNVETLAGEPGDEFELGEVLMIHDGDSVEVGKPTVEGAKVTAKVIEQGRGKKINIVKFKRRKHYRRQMGHRQNYTRVEITGISKS